MPVFQLEARAHELEFKPELEVEDFFPAEEKALAETQIPGGNHYNSRDIGVYVQASYRPVRKFRLVFGERLDDNRIRINGGYGRVNNVRVAAVATPGRWILKAIFSNAFKDADNQAKYSTLDGIRDFPNPGLQLEKVDNYEVSVGKQFTPTLFADLVARLPGSQITLPLNAVTALIGAPIVVWIVTRRRNLRCKRFKLE